MDGIYILLCVVSGTLLFYFVKRLFAKGNIENSYIVSENKKPFLILLLDYETTNMTKNGMTANHAFKIKKISLLELSVVYQTKVAHFGSDILSGFAHIFGMNEDYIFVNVFDSDIVVISNKTGKKLCNKRLIVKNNPELKDFNIRLCVYSHICGSIVIFDNMGYSHLLDPDTISAKKIDFEISPIDNVREPPGFIHFPSLNIDEQFLGLSEPNLYCAAASKIDVNFISEKGSKRYFVHIKTNFSDEKPKGLKQSFLNPKIMNQGNCEIPFFKEKLPSVIIAHTQCLNFKINDIYISKVNAKSEEVWRLPIKKMGVSVALSGYSNLYFSEFKNMLFFYYTKTASHKISISVVDKFKGTIIKAPKLFVNRRI